MDTYQGYNSATNQYKVRSIEGSNKRPTNLLTSSSLHGGSWCFEDSAQLCSREGSLPSLPQPIVLPTSSDPLPSTTLAFILKMKYNSTMPRLFAKRECLAPYSRAIIDLDLTEEPRLLDNKGGFCTMYCCRDEPVVTNLANYEIRYFDNYGEYFANLNGADGAPLSARSYAKESCRTYPDPGPVLDDRLVPAPDFTFRKSGQIKSDAGVVQLEGVYKARTELPLNLLVAPIGKGYRGIGANAIIKLYSNLEGLIGTVDTSSEDLFIFSSGYCWPFFPVYYPVIGEEITATIEVNEGHVWADPEFKLLIGLYGVETTVSWEGSSNLLCYLTLGAEVTFHLMGFLLSQRYPVNVGIGEWVYTGTEPNGMNLVHFSNTIPEDNYAAFPERLIGPGYYQITKVPLPPNVTPRTLKGLLILKPARPESLVTDQIFGAFNPAAVNLKKEFPIPIPALYEWTRLNDVGMYAYYDMYLRQIPKPVYDLIPPPGDFNISRSPWTTSVVSTGVSTPTPGSYVGSFYAVVNTGPLGFNPMGRVSVGTMSASGELVFPFWQVVGETMWGIPPEMLLRQNLTDVAETQPALFKFISTFPGAALGDFPDMLFPLPVDGDYFPIDVPSTGWIPPHPHLPVPRLQLEYPKTSTFGVFSTDPIYTSTTQIGLYHGYQSVIYTGPPAIGVTQPLCFPFLNATMQNNFSLFRLPYPVDEVDFNSKYAISGEFAENCYIYFFAVDESSFAGSGNPYVNWRREPLTPFIGEYEHSYHKTIGEYSICNPEQDPHRWWYGLKYGAYEPVGIDVGDNLYTSFGAVRRTGDIDTIIEDNRTAPRYNITPGSGWQKELTHLRDPIPKPVGVYPYEPFITGNDPVPPELTPAQLAFKDTHTVLLDGTAISCEPVGDLGEAIRLNQPGSILQKFGKIEDIAGVLTFVEDEEKRKVVTVIDVIEGLNSLILPYLDEVEVLTIKASLLPNTPPFDYPEPMR